MRMGAFRDGGGLVDPKGTRLNSLVAAFEAATAAPSGTGIAVAGIAERDDILVGATEDKAPVVYIRCKPSSKPHHPISLAHLGVVFDVACDLVRESGVEESGVFCRLESTDEDADTRRVLLQTLGAPLLALPATVRATDVEATIRRLSEMFRLLSGSARTTALGLWGEMFLISQAPESSRKAAAAAWHSDPHWLQDFGSGEEKLEVKTCVQERRIHKFRLAQLTDGAPEIFVVSYLTKPDPLGLSIEHLWSMIRQACLPDLSLVEHVDRVVVGSLGADLASGLSAAYDSELAVVQRRLYHAESVPQPSTPLAQEILDLHFTVDLSGVNCSSLDDEERPALIRTLGL